MTFNLLPSARKVDIVLFIPLHLYMKYKCTNWFFKMIIKTSKNIVLKNMNMNTSNSTSV